MIAALPPHRVTIFVMHFIHSTHRITCITSITRDHNIHNITEQDVIAAVDTSVAADTADPQRTRAEARRRQHMGQQAATRADHSYRDKEQAW